MTYLITEKRGYNIQRIISARMIQVVHFRAGWELIGFLSNINAEAQNN